MSFVTVNHDSTCYCVGEFCGMIGDEMKNKNAKRMMGEQLFKNQFLDDVHTVVEFDFPMLTVWNCELDIEQFRSLSKKLVSLTADQLRSK